MNSQPTRIIAVFNQAGGVAKTTLTHNLGYHLAQRTHCLLLIDSHCYGGTTLMSRRKSEKPLGSQINAPWVESLTDPKIKITRNVTGNFCRNKDDVN